MFRSRSLQAASPSLVALLAFARNHRAYLAGAERGKEPKFLRQNIKTRASRCRVASSSIQLCLLVLLLSSISSTLLDHSYPLPLTLPVLSSLCSHRALHLSAKDRGLGMYLKPSCRAITTCFCSARYPPFSPISHYTCISYESGLLTVATKPGWEGNSFFSIEGFPYLGSFATLWHSPQHS
jgi:hypothetical protein